MMPLPEVGTAAPDFTAADQTGQSVSRRDFAGRWLILYFYPKDNTPGCTTEAQDFTALAADFAALGAAVVGVSPDSVASHAKFIAKRELNLTLLSDPDQAIATAYGVWGLKKFMGKEYLGIIRSTVAIAPDQTIAQTWFKVKTKGHAATVLSALQTLAAGD
ncbi:MAG: thioredoxin-dependent thiol peroxidase [Spirulinaceae cyanobacterium SM2_1_0]|nr:thioredoxin-dependent thiol peroxidase [Spirulinaceae cyanobacterium SM2_1_0]